MILTKEVTININVSNLKHFKELGYENLEIKKSITIPVEHLTKSSDHKIKVRCDVCEKEMVRD